MSNLILSLQLLIIAITYQLHAECFVASSSSFALRPMCKTRISTRTIVMQTESDQEAGEDAKTSLNRAARRKEEAAAKKRTDGKPKATVQALGGTRVKPGQRPEEPNLVEVLGDASLIGPEEGSRKAVAIPGTNPEQIIMLMRYKNRISGFGAQCTRCKFPMLSAKVEIEKGTMACSVCGAAYTLADGRPVEKAEGTWLTGLFSKTPVGPLITAATLVRDNKVFLGLAKKPADPGPA